MNTLIYNQINKLTEEKKPTTRNGSIIEIIVTHVTQNLRNYLKQLDKPTLEDFIRCPFFLTLDESVQIAIKKEYKNFR